MRRHLLLALCVIGQLSLFTALLQPGDLRTHVPLFLMLFAAAALLYLLAALTAIRQRLSLPVILAITLLLRVPMFFSQPSLSDDVWRYFHDGRAQLAGVNPYAYAPADARTEPFRGPEHGAINHPQLVTIYPPVAQYAFRFAAATPQPLLVWRLLLLAAELVIVAAGAVMLRRSGGAPANLALYAWHPLAIIEGIGSAHVEVLGLAFLLLALTAMATAQPLRAGVALAASVGVKLIAAPLICFAPRRLRLFGVFAATMLLVYLPFVGDGVNVFGSFGTFAERWASNGSLFHVFEPFVGDRGYRLGAVALLLTFVLWLARRQMPIADAAFFYFLVLFALSPVVHPWYLLWILAIIPLRTAPLDTFGWAALIWTFTVTLAYTAHVQQITFGVWRIPAAALLLEYLPVYLLTALALLRSAGQNRAARTFSTTNRSPSAMNTAAKM